MTIPNANKNAEKSNENQPTLPSNDTYNGQTANSSIIEFLNQEQKCLNQNSENDNSELDIDSIFEEINRLSDESDERSVDEILREAELLLEKQVHISHALGDSCALDVAGVDLGAENNGLDANQGVSSDGHWNIDDHLNTISEESTQRTVKSDSGGHSNGVDDKEVSKMKKKNIMRMKSSKN